MSEALLIRRGGGGLPSGGALLRIRAYAGSTVTAGDGTVTRSLSADKGRLCDSDTSLADYYVPVSAASFGVWTVTATLNSYTWSDSLTVSAARQYDVRAYLIPLAYKQVRYLEGTGTQYVITAVRASQARKGTLEGVYISSATNSMIIGAGSGSDAAGGWWFGPNGRFEYDDRVVYAGSLSVGSSLSLSWSFAAGNQQYTINGTARTDNSSTTPTTSRYVGLFVGNTNSSDDVKARAQIKSCTLSAADDTLLGNYIPCVRKSDSAAGFWDTVTETFLTNSGTGSFTVGPDV